jgi:Holliday junction resolvase RusA-like endonuclease
MGGLMNRIAFFIPGIPKPKQRARKGKNNVHYTPEQTETWESILYSRALEHKPEKPWNRPVRVNVDFVLLSPLKPLFPGFAATKPDMDNLEKSLFDALEGVFYTNDSRIVAKSVTKGYGDVPGVKVELFKL